MKSLNRQIVIVLAAILLAACTSQPAFVEVRNGQFYIGDEPYHYVGTNMWYAPILASDGQGSDRERLCHELDVLSELGVKNLRILVGGEGMSQAADHIRPTLQPRPGEYNDTLLQGLDYLMVEMGKRGMKAVLYLHNAWQWSGGYGTYLEWAGEGEPASPSVWNEYTQHHSKFVRNDSTRAMALRHTRFIVGRKNSITGRPYRDDPTIMAWEICNEPRPFAGDSITKAYFLSWIQEQASAIKEIDPRHLVTTGSEGKYGCEMDMELFERIHALPEIDYLCIHIWPFTWNWIGRFASPSDEAKKANDPAIVIENVGMACDATEAYIKEHLAISRRLGKPLVLEEFGYPRDAFEIATSASTSGRDRYYDFVLSQLGDSTGLAGCNFWAWGGEIEPPHPFWQAWDPYTGDPAQEEQGLYSVFATDTTTLSIIRSHIPHP